MKNFYKNKKVLVTGHTGFKGSWLTYILKSFGAEVTGIALSPNTSPALFEIFDLDSKINSKILDIRDLNSMMKVFDDVQPEVVFHLAAQPLVIESYKNPVYTYDVNVMGTVNICECIRLHPCVKSFINITTDKVYQNNEWCYGYREIDNLNGRDPYSNSKSCSELITSSYNNSFFKKANISVSTCRAGNVIGGGDFSENRIIPDCIKYAINKETIVVRNPDSIRPYQHVLEPIFFYLYLGMKQLLNPEVQGEYNIGPNDFDCKTTSNIVDLFCDLWKENCNWKAFNSNNLYESKILKLDCSKAKQILNWRPIWDTYQAVKKTVEWSKSYYNNENIIEITEKEIQEYLKEFEKICQK